MADARDDPGFFEILGQRAGRQRENQLSSTFAACFSVSRAFREVTLRLLEQRMGLALPPAGGAWGITCEVPTPERGGGRPDLCLRHPGHDSIWIENKVEALLTVEQVRKYVKAGATPLVVLTRYHPDVSARELDRRKVTTLRWQDVHQALALRRPAKPADRVLFQWFIEYLEVMGMASSAALTLADIKQLARVFEIARLNKGEDWQAGSGFEAASALLGFLREVRTSLHDQYPKLQTYKRFGPRYGSWADDGDRHHLFAVVWKLDGWRAYATYGIAFPVDDPNKTVWYVSYEPKESADADHEEGALKQITKAGALDKDKFIAIIVAALNRWRLT